MCQFLFLFQMQFISSQSTFQSYSSSLPSEKEMTPPPFFSLSLSQPKGRCTSPAETSNSCLAVFHRQLFLQVCDHLYPTHTLGYFCELLLGCEHGKQKERMNERGRHVSRWSHYGGQPIRVSVRYIAAGEHTMERPHNRSLQSFVKLPFTDPNKLRSWFTAKVSKQRAQFKWQMQKHFFKISIINLAYHASQEMQNKLYKCLFLINKKQIIT